MDAPDELLLAGLAAGDADAARAFVRRWSPRVIGLAVQLLGDRAAAEDVAQEAFVRVWRHAANYDARRGSVTTWLMTIVRNVAIDALRMRRSEPFDPAQLPAMRWCDEPSATDAAEVRADAAQVRDALRTLPVEQRRSLVLAYCGFTANEVAEVERIPLGTAKTRIRNGLARLRVAYTGDEQPDLASGATS